jgi:predicted DsbA family dithiol-disulfide isomerase
MRPFKVEIYSDVVCPWCYIGKRNIEAALDYYRRAYAGEVQPEVFWRPYLLHASVPREGLDRKEFLKQRFPGNANSPAMFTSVGSAGLAVGIEYRFDLITRQSNTIDAHRLIRYVQSRQAVDSVIEDLFKAYFVQGEDISQHELLVDIAGRAGLNRAEVSSYLASEQDVEWVVSEDNRAKKRLGITTVPFMVLNGRKGFSAIQSVDATFRALEWARRDAARPSWWPSFL